jgi:hypothetical protein
VFTNQLAQTLYYARRLPQALATAHRVSELDSTYTRGYLMLARIHLVGGSADSALASLTTAARFGPPLTGDRGLRVLAYAASGRMAEARQLRAALLADSDARRSDGDRMLAALAFGDRVAAMEAMERTLAAHELPTVSGAPGCDPLLEPLHTEPRYLALMQRLGLAVCPVSARGPTPARAR